MHPCVEEGCGQISEGGNFCLDCGHTLCEYHALETDAAVRHDCERKRANAAGKGRTNT